MSSHGKATRTRTRSPAVAPALALETHKTGNSARRSGKKGRAFTPDDSRPQSSKQSLTEAFDKDLYGNGDKFSGYDTSIAVRDDDGDEDMDGAQINGRRLVAQYTATKEQLNEFAHGDTEEADILVSREEQAQIASREDRKSVV